MKKRFFYTIVLLVALGGAWHLAWQAALNKLEVALQQNIKQIENNNIKTSYRLVPYGYPFKVGFSIKDIRIETQDEKTQSRATASFKGESYVYIYLKDIPAALWQKRIKYHTKVLNFEGDITAYNKGKKASVSVHAVRSIGAGIFADKLSYEGIASDVDFYLSTEDIQNQRLLTVNNLSIKTEKSFHKKGNNIKEDFDITGATFFDLKGENSLTVDRLKLSLTLENFPILTVLAHKLKAVNDSNENEVNLVPLKQEIKKKIKLLSSNKSRLIIHNFSLHMGEFKGQFSGALSLDKNFKPQGKMNLSLMNLDTFLANTMGGKFPFAATFAASNESVLLTAETKNNMLFVNGMPILLNLPSLMDIVNDIPDKRIIDKPFKAVTDMSPTIIPVK